MLVIKVIKESFIKYYDELFKFVILNIICFSLFTVPLLLVYISQSFIIIAVLYLIIIAGPTILSGMDFINKSFDRGEASIKDFFIGMKDNFKRGILSFLFPLLIYAIFIMDIIFFLQKPQSFFMLMIIIVFFYLFIIFSMMQAYYWGLLTIQQDTSLWVIIKRSFLLVVDNIIPSILILIVLIILFILNIVLAFLIPFFLFTLIPLIMIIMTRTILEKYEAK